MPIDRMPLDEVQKFLADYHRFLQQLDLGARRKTAEWNYTLDQGSVIDLLLPDAQSMRGYVPMLVLQARVKLLEGDFAAAAHTFETGFAFSRHAAGGPFIISRLIGIAMANKFADRLPEWIERSGSPNLYWSLTALPRPLVSLRPGLEFEQRVLEMEFPDFADLDRPRTPEQWDALLKRFRTLVQRLASIPSEGSTPPMPPATDPNEPAARSVDLPTAKNYLADHLRKTAAEIAAMPPAQILTLYIVNYYRELSDEMFKTTYLPYVQSRPVLAEAVRRLESAPTTEATRLARMMMPTLKAVEAAQNRLERKIAALRTIEALRLYTAAHDGRLPNALSEVSAAPVPDDPGTGKPFEYRREGQTATIISRIPGEPLDTTGLRYRVTVRAK
jgi:hypothetical protein